MTRTATLLVTLAVWSRGAPEEKKADPVEALKADVSKLADAAAARKANVAADAKAIATKTPLVHTMKVLRIRKTQGGAERKPGTGVPEIIEIKLIALGKVPPGKLGIANQDP